MNIRVRQAANQPAKKVQRRKQKQVRFSRASCRWFKKDLTEEEKTKIWYSAEEYKDIQSNIHSDLREAVSRHRKMMKWPGVAPPEDELNVRGLEHHLQGPINMKRQKRRRFVHYVLHTNKYMRVTNPQELRNYAISLSHEDQYRAQRIAAYDAYEAYKVHREANFYQESDDGAMDVFQEFDNVPKASIGARVRCDRTVVAPLA